MYVEFVLNANPNILKGGLSVRQMVVFQWKYLGWLHCATYILYGLYLYDYTVTQHFHNVF